jgi:hypothetical protein
MALAKISCALLRLLPAYSSYRLSYRPASTLRPCIDWSDEETDDPLLADDIARASLRRPLQQLRQLCEMSGDVTGFVLGQSIHRHVPSVFAHGIDVGASRMQRLSAVSSTI